MRRAMGASFGTVVLALLIELAAAPPPAATAQATTAPATTSTTTMSVARPPIIRLSNGEFIGLMTVCRYVQPPEGPTSVMLSTGSTISLTEPKDIAAVRRGLGELSRSGQLQLFWPSARVAINLDQVTNVWNDAKGFTFWSTDGKSWIVGESVDRQRSGSDCASRRQRRRTPRCH